MKDNNQFLHYEELVTREFYELYKRRRRHVAKEIDQYKLFEKAVGGFLELLANSIVEEEGGVYIKGLGYFCAPRRLNVNKKHKNPKATSILKKFSTREQHYPYLFVDDQLKGWTMNRGFTSTIIFKIRAQKKEYKLHFDVAYTYHNAKKLAKSLKKRSK